MPQERFEGCCPSLKMARKLRSIDKTHAGVTECDGRGTAPQWHRAKVASAIMPYQGSGRMFQAHERFQPVGARPVGPAHGARVATVAPE